MDLEIDAGCGPAAICGGASVRNLCCSNRLQWHGNHQSASVRTAGLRGLGGTLFLRVLADLCHWDCTDRGGSAAAVEGEKVKIWNAYT